MSRKAPTTIQKNTYFLNFTLKVVRQSQFQGKEKSILRARKRGNFLARERLELLLDKDSRFLELLLLAGME